jgi:N-acetylmuramoyl-L-alanine amidase
MQNDIKRRLLHEIVQDNLGTYTPAPSPTLTRVERKARVVVRKMLLVAVALVLLPVDDMSKVISTAIEQPNEAPRSVSGTVPPLEAPPPPDERVSVPEQYLAALEPQVEVPPPLPAGLSPVSEDIDLAPSPPRPLAPSSWLFPASEEVKSAEPTFPAPAPINLAVIPLRVRKIVVDPGHGGKDTGTSVTGGLTEKEVTLDIGLRLRRLLEQAAFEVVMTRDKDEAVPLQQRTALANAQGADLFVSIHLNWIDQSQVRGMETYYLGPTEDPLLLELAAQENRDSGYSLADFRKLLDRLYLSVRRDESRRLAETVQHTLVTSLHPKKSTRVNRGVKTAPFAVLVGTDMPAILAEVACLSNAAEAQLLATPQYRQDIAQALLQGIRAYAQALHRSPRKGS